MPQPNKYGRVTVEIDHTQYDAAAKIAGKEGRKIYAVYPGMPCSTLQFSPLQKKLEIIKKSLDFLIFVV